MPDQDPPTAVDVWGPRLLKLNGLGLSGPEIEAFVTALVDAIGDETAKFFNLLDLNGSLASRSVDRGEKFFRDMVQDANTGRLLSPQGAARGPRDLFLVAIGIAPGSQSLAQLGARLEARTQELPQGAAVVGGAVLAVLDPRYAEPIAAELNALFSVTVDLSILHLPPPAPPPPADNSRGSWLAWLGRCRLDVLEAVLTFLQRLPQAAQKATVARLHLQQRKVLTDGSFELLDNVPNRQVVVNRTALSARLDLMLGGSKLLLRVEGADRSRRGLGKTFTRSILRALLVPIAQSDHVVVDLEVAQKSLEEVARELLKGMGADLKLLPDRNDSTSEIWPERVANVVLNAATQGSTRGVIHWLVFDGCGLVQEQDDLGQFFQLLGLKIEAQYKYQTQGLPRIVLIEGSAGLAKRRTLISTEDTLEPISRTDIEKLFKARSLDAQWLDRVYEPLTAGGDPTRALQEMQNRIQKVMDGGTP